MTILCATCGAVIAERCPHCRTRKLSELMGNMGTKVTYWCNECHKFFGAGQGGGKKELCAACTPQQQNLLTQIPGRRQ